MLDRKEALRRLQGLIGRNLRPLADKHGVTVWRGDGRLNKGWAGHVIERHLGLPLNSSRAPNFGSWELKLVSLKHLKKSGAIVPKETMAICMIDPQFVSATPFKQSHLLSKLNKLVVCARLYESRAEEHTILYSVGTFDLDDPATYAQVKADYELVQSTIKTTGFSALTGKMGVLVQPRTKGPGHGSTSRAFYARKGFVSAILGLGLSGRTA